MSLLPIALLIGVWIYFMNRMQGGGKGGAMGFGKSKAKMLTEKHGRVTEGSAPPLSIPGNNCKRRLRPTGVQLDGLKFQGSNSSIRFAGCPAAIASSVALR